MVACASTRPRGSRSSSGRTRGSSSWWRTKPSTTRFLKRCPRETAEPAPTPAGGGLGPPPAGGVEAAGLFACWAMRGPRTVTKPTSARRCSIHVNTAVWVSRSISRRVREIVEWSGAGSGNSRCKKLRTLNESAARPRDRPLRVQPFKVAEHQQPEVPPRRQTRPPDPVGVKNARTAPRRMRRSPRHRTAGSAARRTGARRGRSLVGIHIDACRARRRRLPIAMSDSVVRGIDHVDP